MTTILMQAHIKRLAVLAFYAIVTSFQLDAFAFRVDAASYQYPYKDPYLATTTVAIMKDREDSSFDTVSRRDLEINILDGRNDIHFLEGKGKLRFRFYQQNNLAPLIFIIPGLGGSSIAGSINYIAELLIQHGFHVLILPSPFNWNFVLAASRSGFPGITRQDSADLYSAMQLTLSHIKKHYDAKVSKIGIIGLSGGAFYAAYLSTIDSEQRKIVFDTYLLINPPVDLVESIEKIDRIAALEEKVGPEQRTRIKAYALGVIAETLKKELNEPDYFADWDKRFLLTDKQIKYLIGDELQSSIGDVIYVVELIHHLGLLKTPVTPENRSRLMAEAHSYSIMDYVNLFLPRLNQMSGAQVSMENIRTSLRSIESMLMKNENIFLMHNRDDFLLSHENLDYIERIFGNRAKIYPYGGHLGNLWYPQNEEDIVRVFKPLLGSVLHTGTGGPAAVTD